MGNSDAYNDTTAVWYPAAFGQGIIAVGATDKDDLRRPTSCVGQHIDVAAPGEAIWSTIPPLDSYGYMSGTSMAAPHVIGVAGLLRGRKPSLTPDDIEQVIRLSAAPVGAEGFDNATGAGRLDVAKALDMISGSSVFPFYTFRQPAIVVGGVVQEDNPRWEGWMEFAFPIEGLVAWE